MNNKKIKNITVLILGILFVVTIFFAIKSSSEGAKLAILEERSELLANENQELNDQIVSQTSLTKVNEQAEKMGMVKVENFVYINNSGIALR